MAMMRPLVLLTLCCALATPASITAHIPTCEPFHVTGRVYCDTCRAGFETTASTFIAGARVRMECKDSETLELKYSLETTTDYTGTFNFTVDDDHEDQMCACSLVESPISHCNVADPGRCHATAVLTRNMNGVVDSHHIVNNMGFLINEPVDECNQILQEYFPTHDQDK